MWKGRDSEGQLFGRRFCNCLKDLNVHVSRSFRSISNELAEPLTLMVELLTENAPRPVDVNFLDWVHIYVDASFEPSGYSSVGGLILDSMGKCLGKCLGCFSEEITPALVSKLKRKEQQT